MQERCNLPVITHTKVYSHAVYVRFGWSRWPRGQRRRSAASRLLGLRVRIRPGAWMSVCCGCCVLSDWSLVHRAPTERGVSKCGRGTSKKGGPGPLGAVTSRKKKCEFWAFYLSSGEVSALPACDAVWVGWCFSTSQRNCSLPLLVVRGPRGRTYWNIWKQAVHLRM